MIDEVNLGSSIEPIHNPVSLVEIAVEKGATAILIPVSCRRQLFDLSDYMATKVDIKFYSDAKDVIIKAIKEVQDIFGEDLTFDLQGLLIEKYCSNLRNNMAHGLLDYGNFYSPSAIYLWWITLHIILSMKNNEESHEF